VSDNGGSTLKVRLISVLAVLSFVAVIAGYSVAASSGAGTTQDTALIYDGPAIANTHAAPNTPAFAAWCGTDCIPSVVMPAVDASTGRVRGQIYVWTKNFVYSADGNSLCFGEFVWFALSDGDVYSHSGSNGTCGAFMDPSLKPPTHISGVGKVVAGGGDGTIVGGTGKYAKWTGIYTDRTFVELDFSGGPNYYDQIFWSIQRS
jgi:hypothetical protein